MPDPRRRNPPAGISPEAYHSLRTLRTVRYAPRTRTLRPGRTATAATSASPGLGRNTCPDNPLQLWAAVSEAVLLQRVGSPHVMNAQLKHLLASSEHLHAAIQVLPH
ncbi:Scr1 family TA system antitoxin-like transcriptional regulator [Streptomyces sp. NPDC047917]|uniref:Scr1 family TA system antitoxin-like transcriptional regulator n=1 Tax=Streptomyces sp. NPDC047917 TaxID=3365491 RepID=UPI0037173127